jgi:RND superfamily putative drug exporter
MPLQAPPPLPAPSPFTRIGSWAAARPRSIAAVFAVLLALSGAYAASVAQRLPAGGFDVPGSDSFRVGAVSQERLGVGKPDLVLLYRRSDGAR